MLGFPKGASSTPAVYVVPGKPVLKMDRTYDMDKNYVATYI